MRRKLAAYTLPLMLAVPLFVAPACAPSSESIPDEVVDGEAHGLSVQPGDPYQQDGVTVIAPQPREGVFAEILFDDGFSKAVHLKTDEDGVVWQLDDVVIGGDPADDATQDPADPPLDDPPADDVTSTAEAATERTASGSPGPCSDSAKRLLGFKWAKPLEWSFQSGSTPDGNSIANVEAKLKAAASNITTSKNSCGLADQVSAKHSYLGRTTRGTQIGADASCKGTGDGFNTIGFGALPDGVLGLACVWYDGDGHAVEADIRFTKSRKWFAVKPSACSGQNSIEGVATHEFGHAFGLGHVGEPGHGNQTMSPAINGPCQSSEATLGLGDVKGLRALY
jgi:hypothetical protein